MVRKATLKVYTGTEWKAVTGRVVRVYDTGGVTIDDENGVRYFAMKDRATIHPDNINKATLRNNTLW